ncbi:hypothetical protein CSAL01_10967 [Colletotrichum salicis]|uniref:Uncharacterized protein n=1 Tax=Colletotrichum salicis TaxID=1209931 RepID=A0A135TJ54_9PEZI|nr:hypothetical protein CSAL01_10967 [Colletotrichum salicis]
MRSQRLPNDQKNDIAKLDARQHEKGGKEVGMPGRSWRGNDNGSDGFGSRSRGPRRDRSCRARHSSLTHAAQLQLLAAMRPLPSFSLSLQRFADCRPHLEKARTKTRTKREPTPGPAPPNLASSAPRLQFSLFPKSRNSRSVLLFLAAMGVARNLIDRIL